MTALVVHRRGLCTSSCDHDPVDGAQVEECRSWLRIWAMPRPTVNTSGGSSYSYKHDVERDRGVYASNGSFIVAAILEGFDAVPVAANSPNAYFNFDVRDPFREARRLLGRASRVEWLSGYPGVLRIRTAAGELTCLPSELRAVAPWILAGGTGPMPVPEFTRRPWGPEYRWTARANVAATEIEGRARKVGAA